MEAFAIEIPDSVLQDLDERLRRTQLPIEPTNAGWDYGANLAAAWSRRGWPSTHRVEWQST